MVVRIENNNKRKTKKKLIKNYIELDVCAHTMQLRIIVICMTWGESLKKIKRMNFAPRAESKHTSLDGRL